MVSHDHDYLGHHHDENARRTRWVVWLSAGMMVAEIVAGWLTGSMALLADGFHMATHVGALGMAALAYSYARRNVGNPRYGWGTGKVGELAAFASALVLGIVSLGIAVESIMRLGEHHPVAFGDATLVAVLGLLVNLASAALLGGGHHHHGSRHDHDHDHHHSHAHAHAHDHAHGDDANMRAAYLHVLADALTSVMAIAALLAGRYLGWWWLDPLTGLIGAVVIARWSWTLMRDASAVLLDATDPALAARVRACVEGAGDVQILDMHVWRIGPGAHAAIVEVRGTVTSATLRQRLSPIPALAHVTIEVR